MNRKIWLYWSKTGGSTHGNFGDELGPYIISRLGANDVRYLPFPRSGLYLFLGVLRAVLNRRKPVQDLINTVLFLCSGANYVMSAGSIIGWGRGSRRLVWGSGVISSADVIPPATFFAVRGKETNDLLTKQGYDAPGVFGDPALLLPLVYHPEVEKSYRVGLILHYAHEGVVNVDELPSDVLVINLMDDIERVISKILSCERIVSTSLHGIIVSNAYGIAALWAHVPELPLSGDSIKFKDYFSSVGVDYYQPINMRELKFEGLDSIFMEYKDRAEIQIDLSELQEGLLAVAPFDVDQRFCNKAMSELG